MFDGWGIDILATTTTYLPIGKGESIARREPEPHVWSFRSGVRDDFVSKSCRLYVYVGPAGVAQRLGTPYTALVAPRPHVFERMIN